jgi:amino acid transporter
MSSAQQTVPVRTTTSPQRLGRPVLTTVDAIAQSLAIGPIFSAAFVAFLIAAAAAGAAPLATLIGAVGVLSVGWVITLYARRYAGAGAMYDYLRRMNPTLGLFGAGLYFIGTLVLDCGGYLVIGFLSTQIFQNYLHLNIPAWVNALIAAAVLFTVNHRGVRLTTRLQLTLSALASLPLLLLAMVIIARGGDSGNTLQVLNPTLVPLPGLFGGVLFAITLFIGFETSASLGEETANPRRSIPRAVIGTVLITTAFYLLMIYATDIGFGINHTDKWDLVALDTLATRYVGSWLAILVDIAILFDALAVMSAFMATTSRGYFALARHGLLPSPLAQMSRFRTPLGGNLLVLVAALITIIGTAVSRIDIPTIFTNMTLLGSLLIEAIYIVLALAAIRMLLEEPGKWWRWLILLVAIVTPLLGIYGSVAPFPAYPGNLGVFGAIAGAALAGAWTLIVMIALPKRLAAASRPHSWEIDAATAPAQ